MKGRLNVNNTHCRSFRHLYGFLSLTAVALFSAVIMADSREIPTQKISKGRAPASAFAAEEFEQAPAAQTIWLQKVWIADHAGVMDRVRNTFDYWDSQEEYAKNWNLESTGLFDIRDSKERASYFGSNILKYVDKRISGEIKNAEEGSAFHTVGQVQEALKPDAEVGLTENYKLKFRARVLEGKGTMLLINPYCEASMVVKLNGELNLVAKKKFDDIDTEAGIDVSVDEGRWLASIDHKITDNLIARASSELKVDFSRETDTKLEFYFRTSF
jgi:hypothetical protein